MTKPVKADNSLTNMVNHINLCVSSFLHENQWEKLGQTYKDMSEDEAHSNLIFHRMSKKFANVTPEGKDDRRTNTIKKMVEYDLSGIQDFEHKLRCDLVFNENQAIRHHLYQARILFNEVISTYNLRNTDLRFPSGETYVSSGGDVSLYAKLRSRDQWCCTNSAFDNFAVICYNSPMLKFAARRHFAMWQVDTGKTFSHSAMWTRAKELKLRNPAFEIFKAKLRCIVTFVVGARITTVDKDLENDRVIECDAFCNMIVQLCIDSENKRMIKDYFDIDLDEAQTIHRLMIADSSNSTIDFSNASNSVWLSVIKWFCNSNSRYLRDLESSRCGLVELPEGDIHPLTMLSPMGNGFTFSVMTLLILSIARVSDSFAHVFGDDLIIDNHVADHVVSTLSYVGLQTNMTKTFIDSPFRESCGGFVYQEKYLTSFDLEWANDVVDAVVILNKVWVLSFNSPPLLSKKLRQLHRDMLRKVPAHLLRVSPNIMSWATRKLHADFNSVFRARVETARKSTVYPWIGRKRNQHGEVMNLDYLPSLHEGVWASKKTVLLLQKDCEKSAKAYKRLRANLAKEHKIPPSNIHIQPYLQVERVAKRYRFKPKINKAGKLVKGRKMVFHDNVQRLTAWFYIWQGKVDAPHVDQNDIKETWTYTYL